MTKNDKSNKKNKFLYLEFSLRFLLSVALGTVFYFCLKSLYSRMFTSVTMIDKLVLASASYVAGFSLSGIKLNSSQAEEVSNLVLAGSGLHNRQVIPRNLFGKKENEPLLPEFS